MAQGATAGKDVVHPISHRVRAVLVHAVVHDEVETRRALDTLADMYSLEATKGSKSPALVDTSRARTHLETDTRASLHATTNKLLTILRTVDESLVALGGDVAQMQTSCDLVHQRLDHAAQSTSYLVEHAEGLSQQRDTCVNHAQVAQLFLQRFTLSDEQRKHVNSRELRVGPELFDVMDKLACIRTDCQVLLQESEDGATKAGLEIMKSTADDLEQCYQKLYKWCSFEFRQPIKDGLEVSSSLRQAVFRLKSARQDLLRSALATLVQTRSSILANAFVTALTIGAGPPTHLPGPIELHAHDPLRYIGDMLAWIHQTVASEREFLTSLFGEQEGEGGRRIGQRRRGLEGSLDLTHASDPDSALLTPGEALVREVLNQNMEGCCRPLKIRVQQTVRSQEGSVTTYRLAHLVHFYRLTMQRTVGSHAVLSKTLAEMSASALDAFVETLKRQAAGLQRYDDLPDADLGPPAPLLATMATLKELLGEYSRSLAEDQPVVDKPASGTAEASLQDFAFVLNTIVDPMVGLCDRMAAGLVARRSNKRATTEQQATGPRWEALIFVANCLDHLASLLADFASFAHGKYDELQTLLHERLAELSEMHFNDVLRRTGLFPVHQTLLQQGAEGGEPLSRIPGTTPQDLTAAFAQLETFLTSDDTVISPTPAKLAKLYSPKHRHEVSQRALTRVTDVYGAIVDAVMQSQNKYEWKDTLVRRSRDEIRILLGL